MLKYTFTAPELTSPTFDTLEEYSKKRFGKLEKLLSKNDKRDFELRISVKMSGHEYQLMADIIGIEGDVVKVKNRDIRRAVEEAATKLKNNLSKDKQKRVSLKRVRSKVRTILGRD